MTVPADPPAQLVQLREPEAFGVLDHHHARVRHVDADLHDRRRDEQLQLARRERLHHPLLAVALQPAVQQADAVLRKHFLREVIGHLGGRLQVDLLGLFDQRIDHVGLTAQVQLLAHELMDVVATALRLRRGLDRLASRRRVANDRDVEIAVQGQRERARNRRRRHHQHVRPQALRPERRPLQHAEPMLLVDDHQTELLEPDVALDQRVGPDHEVQRARLDFRQLRLARGGAGGAGQQRDAKPRRLQQPRDVHEMLLRQDLGRRHERHLQAVLHRDQRRQQRDDRLARADVALQQPVHRMRALQVLDDLLERLSLPRRELERQHAAGRLADAIVDVDRMRFEFGRRASTSGQNAELKQERLFENQPPLRRRVEAVDQIDRRPVRRKMRREQCRASRRQVEPQPDGVRQRIGQLLRQPLERVVHQLALDLRGDAAGLLVDRYDPAGVHRLAIRVVENLVLRIRQLQTAGTAHLGEAEQDDLLPAREHVAQERLVEPRHANRAAGVGDQRLENLEAGTPGRSQTAARDAAHDRRRLAGPKRRNRLKAAAIFVADGKPVQQVFDGEETDALEIGGATRTDAFEELQGRREQLGGHCTTYGSSRLHLNLADPGRQRKRVVEADPGRILRRARVVADDLLQQHLRDRHRAERRRFELEPADAVARRESPVAVTGSRPVARFIGSSMVLDFCFRTASRSTTARPVTRPGPTMVMAGSTTPAGS